MSLFLFDIDGTLITGLGDYESALEEAIWTEFQKKVKVSLEGLHGLTDKAILRETLKRNNINVKEDSVSRCLFYFGEIYTASKEKTKLLPDVEETLEQLRNRGDFLALVTGNATQFARKRLALYDLNKYLPSGAFGEESYERADLVAFAVSRAETRGWKKDLNDVYVVGDTIHDIRGGKRAGTRSVGVLTGKATTKDFQKEGADYIIKDLAGLLTL